MKKLIAMHGLPRSGKSTICKRLSKELAAPIVNKDNIRLALHGQVYSALAEPMVRAIYKVMIHSLFLSGHPIVLADETHYSIDARNFVADGPWETEFLAVPTSPLVCTQRAIATNQPWLVSVIKEMAFRHEPLESWEKHSEYCQCVACTKQIFTHEKQADGDECPCSACNGTQIEVEG